MNYEFYEQANPILNKNALHATSKIKACGHKCFFTKNRFHIIQGVKMTAFDYQMVDRAKNLLQTLKTYFRNSFKLRTTPRPNPNYSLTID